MNGILANLLHEDNGILGPVARSFRTGGYTAPYVALVLIGILAVLVGGYFLWSYRRRQLQQPGPRMLLKRAGDTLGLNAADRRLVWRLGGAVGLEPAAALVSPEMLLEMVHRAERRGHRLSSEQSAHLSEILDIVAAAATPA